MATATEERTEQDVATPAEVDAREEQGQGGEEQGEEVVQLSIAGDENLSLTVGGMKPNEATLLFRGGEIQIANKTQFKKGQRVAVVLVGDITEVTNKDLKDPKTKRYTKSKKIHVLTADDVRRVPLELVEGLEPTA